MKQLTIKIAVAAAILSIINTVKVATISNAIAATNSIVNSNLTMLNNGLYNHALHLQILWNSNFPPATAKSEQPLSTVLKP